MTSESDAYAAGQRDAQGRNPAPQFDERRKKEAYEFGRLVGSDIRGKRLPIAHGMGTVPAAPAGRVRGP